MTQTKKVGAHVSAAGGIDKAIEKAYGIGCNCVQIFSGSPRVWAKKPLSLIDTDKLFSAVRQYSVTPIFTHALYLVNLASNKPELLRKSFDSLKYELEFDALVKGSGVIVHVGSHQGRGWEAVKAQVVGELVKLLEATPLSSKLLIENSAGQEGKIGSPLEEIRYLLDECEKAGGFVSGNRLGWCFDTCHAFASGYHLAHSKHKKIREGQAELLNMGVEEKYATQEIASLKLWDTLACIHVNDSRDPFNSGRDRHANLGEGTIEPSEFKVFLNHEKVLNIPLILEVPGEDKQGPDAENVSRLKKIIGMQKD